MNYIPASEELWFPATSPGKSRGLTGGEVPYKSQIRLHATGCGLKCVLLAAFVQAKKKKKETGTGDGPTRWTTAISTRSSCSLEQFWLTACKIRDLYPKSGRKGLDGETGNTASSPGSVCMAPRDGGPPVLLLAKPGPDLGLHGEEISRPSSLLSFPYHLAKV